MDTKALIDRATAMSEALAARNYDAMVSAQDGVTMLRDLVSAIEVLSNPAVLDGTRYRIAQIERKIAASEYNASSIKLDLYGIKERCAELMSQHEPVASIGIDREQLRQALQFVLTGRLK